MKRVVLLFISAILLVSCEKEIEFKGEQTDPKLVINSVVESGQPIMARISKSVFFLDNNEDTEAPADVVATLYVNGNRIGEMTQKIDTIWETKYYWTPEPTYRLWKVYTHPYCPSVGDEVKITASANGFDDVEGSTGTIPNHTACQIKDIRLIENDSWAYTDDFGDTTDRYCSYTYELSLEVTDPRAGEMDFFKLGMDEDYHFIDGYEHYNFYSYSYIMDYSDPVFGPVSSTNIDIIDYQLDDPNGTFTDLLFDGRSYTIKVPIRFFYFTTIEGLEPNPCPVAVYVEHITKDYYNYLNTCEQGDGDASFFSEPIQTHTNVNGGYGIVAGRSVDTLWVTLPLTEK
jgi:hypothetical protein